MTTHPQLPVAQEFVVESNVVVLSPAEQAAKSQAKAIKKERKHARMRLFFAWCAGCRSMGGSF